MKTGLDEENPYVGPRPYTRSDPESGRRLYGRSRDLREFLNLLIAERVVLLYSPSGAGKTSLIQASLIGQLEAQDFLVLPIIRVDKSISGAANRYVASTILYAEGAKENSSSALPALGLTDAEIAKLTLPEYFDRRFAETASDKMPVLIFDQFEEIATADPTDRPQKEAFFRQLGQVLKNPARWALFSMREDYLATLERFWQYLPTRARTTFRLDLLEVASATEAIIQPAASRDVTFEPLAAKYLADKLRTVRVQLPGAVEDKLGPVIEPLYLQIVCFELWHKLMQRSPRPDRITLADVQTIDVDIALGGFYDRVLSDVAAETQVRERSIRRWVDRNLLKGQDLRGQVLRDPGERTEGLQNAVIDALLEYQLLRREERGNRIWIELAHDLMVRPIAESNELFKKTRLTKYQRTAELWVMGDRPPGLLLTGHDLVEAEGWAKDNPDELEDDDRRFLQASLDAREEAEHERQRQAEFERMRLLSRSLALAAQSTRLFGRSEPDDLVALLAHQAYCFHERAGGQFLDLMDDALRPVFYKPHFCSSLPQILPPGAPTQTSMMSRTPPSILSLAFTASGETLVAARADGVYAWSVRQPANGWRVLTGTGVRVASMAASSVSEQVAWGDEQGRLVLYDLTTQSVVWTSHKHFDRIGAVCFSHDGCRLATGCRAGYLNLWQIDGQLIRGIGEYNPAIVTLAFSPDDQLIAMGGDDDVIQLYNCSTGALERTLEGHEDRINSVAFGPNGNILVSASRDQRVALWNMEQLSQKPAPVIITRKEAINAVAFSREGETLALSGHDAVKILKVTGDELEPTRLTRDKASATAVAFGPQGKSLAYGDANGSVHLVDLTATRTRYDVVGRHPAAVTSIAIAGNGDLIVSAGNDKKINVWNQSQVQPLTTWAGKKLVPPMLVAISADGRRIAATGAGRNVLVWDRGLKGRPHVLTHTTDLGPALALSPDGRYLASACIDHSALVWDLDDPKDSMRVFTGPVAGVLAVALSKDGWLATAGEDTQIRMQNLSGSSYLLPGHKGAVRALAFTVDGAELASAGDDSIVRLWRVGEPDLAPRQLMSIDGRVFALAFHRSGTQLAVGYDDKSVWLWDLRQMGSPSRIRLGEHDCPVTGVAFHPDGRTVISSSEDGTIRAWLKTGCLADDLCGKLQRNLSAGEWRQYVGEDLQYEQTCPSLPPGEDVSTAPAQSAS